MMKWKVQQWHEFNTGQRVWSATLPDEPVHYFTMWRDAMDYVNTRIAFGATYPTYRTYLAGRLGVYPKDWS